MQGRSSKWDSGTVQSPTSVKDKASPGATLQAWAELQLEVCCRPLEKGKGRQATGRPGSSVRRRVPRAKDTSHGRFSVVKGPVLEGNESVVLETRARSRGLPVMATGFSRESIARSLHRDHSLWCARPFHYLPVTLGTSALAFTLVGCATLASQLQKVTQ